jgi:molybdopterin-guanine dinucleotide biosynthesis protein A
MDAIVLAGGLNRPDDPLYALTGVEKKALIPLAGKPMINWIVEALSGSGLVEHLVIAGLKPDEASFDHSPVHFVDRVGGIIDNILAAVDRLKKVNLNAKKVLLCNSDIPLITPEIVRSFVADCGDQEADIYYAIVEEKTMEANFPNSKRTYVPFKHGRYTGGDIYLSDISVPDRIDLDLFRTLMSSRKNYLRQARTLGFGFIIKLLLRRAAIEETAERARKLIHVDARVVKTPYAELGMDLDKPHQYELIKAILEKRQAHVNEGI